MDNLDPARRRWQDAGAHRRFADAESGALADTAAIRAALQELDGSQWAGAETSPADRSAVRMAAQHEFAMYPVRAALHLAQTLLEGPRPAQATDVLTSIRDFATAAGLSRDRVSMIDELINETPSS